eukprot:CAMPEP_0185574896 /NCGR_PEP_ID=MMETSP0434-20130131/6240_1 /TAXON_ID=626734 ORGANISM="Favella taraikaensis, Strain Fe Narragansett Bay" /NCGR_SAMPLE_ID=MMETSP0434 /ASSEMBLY_ACC=CAM_ASM_000379 /LENGTH=89 /DNA_ID=CAMNT_0028191615 /DNA_START=758 /DNA_END=1027 /DNA_ORIENTATION=-
MEGAKAVLPGDEPKLEAVSTCMECTWPAVVMTRKLYEYFVSFSRSDSASTSKPRMATIDDFEGAFLSMKVSTLFVDRLRSPDSESTKLS